MANHIDVKMYALQSAEIPTKIHYSFSRKNVIIQ